MARNINLKLNNLKINTNVEHLYEAKTPLNGNVRKSQVNTASPKKNNYNSLSGHTPSLSIGVSGSGINSSKYFSEEKTSLTNLHKGVRANSKSKGGNLFSAGQINSVHINTNTMPSDSSGTNTNTSQSNSKSKDELDIDGRFCPMPNTFSPKSTKTSGLNAGNKIISNASKFVPLSTRGNGMINSYNTLNSALNYNSNGPDNTPNKNTAQGNINSDSKNNGELINVMSLLGSQNNTPITIKNLSASIPNYDNSKYSVKSMSVIKAYAANTHQGIIRSYNEDRVSIILNIIKPTTFTGEVWPKCSFFGIYDGHGGANCADFLRDSLHQFIIKDPNFPMNVKEAIKKGFEAAERDYLTNYALNRNGDVVDRSGSCAVVTMVVDNICYVANVGDSRAIMSLDSGKEIMELTNDHKPNDANEKKRIVESGGKVYQTQTPAKNFNLQLNNVGTNQMLVGPHRVFPGRLSVSRTFGDVEAKTVKFGGLPNVIIATPEIISFEIKDNMDFIIMGCDGIFDQLTNVEVIDSVWMTAKEGTKCKNIHLQSGTAVDMVIKSSLVRRTLDNVTCVMIAFSNFEKIFRPLEQDPTIDKQSSFHSYDSEKKAISNKIGKQNEDRKITSASHGSHSSHVTAASGAQHCKYDSYNGGGINLEAYKYGVIDSHHKKNYIQKKLVSLDMSNKKGATHNSLIGKEGKDLSGKKKLDYSEQFEHKKAPYLQPTLQPTDYHPSTTKHINIKLKDNNSLLNANTIKKISSVKGINDKCDEKYSKYEKYHN